MKKNALFCFLLFAISSAYSQRFADRVRVGVFYQPQYVWILNAEDSKAGTIYDYKTTPDNAFGANFEYWLNNNWSFLFEGSYSAQGGGFTSLLDKGTSQEREIKQKKRLKYIKGALLMSYHYKFRPRWTVAWKFGPQVGYLIGVGGPVVGYKDNGGAGDQFDNPPADFSHYNRITVEATAAMGVEFRAIKRLALFLYFNTDYGFLDVENKEATAPYGGGQVQIYKVNSEDRPAAHNFTAGIQIGATYYFSSEITDLLHGAPYKF